MGVEAKMGGKRKLPGFESAGLPYGRIVGSGDCQMDGIDALLEEFFAVAMMLAKEVAERAVVATLQVLQIGPTLEQVGYHGAGHVVEPL